MYHPKRKRMVFALQALFLNKAAVEDYYARNRSQCQLTNYIIGANTPAYIKAKSYDI